MLSKIEIPMHNCNAITTNVNDQMMKRLTIEAGKRKTTMSALVRAILERALEEE